MDNGELLLYYGAIVSIACAVISAYIRFWRLERDVKRLTAELDTVKATIGMDAYTQAVMQDRPVVFWRGQGGQHG